MKYTTTVRKQASAKHCFKDLAAPKQNQYVLKLTEQ